MDTQGTHHDNAMNNINNLRAILVHFKFIFFSFPVSCLFQGYTTMMLLGENSFKWVSPLLISGAGEEYGEKNVVVVVGW